jgi:hypothetical protein
LDKGILVSRDALVPWIVVLRIISAGFWGGGMAVDVVAAGGFIGLL